MKCACVFCSWLPLALAPVTSFVVNGVPLLMRHKVLVDSRGYVYVGET